ncbi:MAG: hypothetical protein ACHQZS_03850 [Candidatus Binatales bacterium]
MAPRISSTLTVIQTRFKVDAMYFHAARESHARALKEEKRVRRARLAVDELEQRRQDALDAHGGDAYAAGDEIERICTQLERKDYALGEAYGPYLQALAVAHILAAASLESHINARAKEKLPERFKEFEALGLEKKWKTFPEWARVPRFDQDAEPFRSLSRLVGFRNALIHYKDQAADWDRPAGIPPFLEELGLSTGEVSRSLACARNMIAELAKKLGGGEPVWLGQGGISYFEIEVHDLPRAAQ